MPEVRRAGSPRSRAGRAFWPVVKTCGVVAGASIVAAWFVSRWYSGYVSRHAAGVACSVHLSGGSVEFMYYTNVTDPTRWVAKWRLLNPPRWLWIPRLVSMKNPNTTFLILPLWIPFLLVGGPTGLMFYRDRIASRRGPGTD